MKLSSDEHCHSDGRWQWKQQFAHADPSWFDKVFWSLLEIFLPPKHWFLKITNWGFGVVVMLLMTSLHEAQKLFLKWQNKISKLFKAFFLDLVLRLFETETWFGLKFDWIIKLFLSCYWSSLSWFGLKLSQF